jgi:hypothetical protein
MEVSGQLYAWGRFFSANEPREAYALNKKLAHLEVLKKSICPCQDSNPTWSCSQSNHHTNYGTPAPKN